MRRRTTRSALLAGLALALALLPLTGCAGAGGGDGGGGLAAAGPPPPEEPSGRSCAALPADGPGSLESMGRGPVLTAIDQAKDLTAMSALIRTARAKDLLDSMDNVTVFAPDDAAFGRLTDDQRKALATPPGAGDLLRKLIVVRDLRRSDLTDTSYTSLQGAVLQASGSGEEYRIGGAQVLCGSIRTANARLAMLDRVPDFGG
ncbi:fasciclin domain-containing protein [Kitasatospora sp. NBC_01287]|uniref:fasciclin domain-containing protein n=1 Tax=Kitasatospora sp. NBC_01287 TaxID=2903573 RepID=UPI00224E7F2B|nr:fasciclin domain-containing protein [Kitasatospora sp. NBC_01287]MCX4750188.1 fasciclin domain-containing protein [Kitasatospora sp. NBC_01287]